MPKEASTVRKSLSRCTVGRIQVKKYNELINEIWKWLAEETGEEGNKQKLQE
jgi:hypothetical protein